MISPKIKIIKVVIPTLIPTASSLKKRVAIAVVKLAAKIFAILLPTRMVASNSLGFSVMKAMAAAFLPPALMSCRARSIPIDINTASEPEKNADVIKQTANAISSYNDKSEGGSID